MISSDNENGCTIPAIGLDTERLSDERTSQLKRLLQLNHGNYSILYNNYRFHNHSPHFLGSAYLYGGSSKYLQHIYDDIVFRDNMESWSPSPGPITLNNYRAHLGKGEYQRAWVDFFEEQMRDDSHNWQGVVIKLLLDVGSKDEIKSAPMLQCLTTALGHPLIHLGYAFELNSRELAAEALGLIATCYDEQYVALVATKPDLNSAAPDSTSDILEVFKRVFSDTDLPSFPQPGDEHIEEILDKTEYVQIIESYVNSWRITDPVSQLLQAYHFASLLLVSTAPQLGGQGFDFFLVHMLTTIHAVRVLLPHFPTQNHATLLREWLLIAVLAYVAQNRPKLNPAYIRDFDLKGRDWEYVQKQAVEGKYSIDAHFVKACRALHVGAATCKDIDNEDWFLRCAVRFVSEFDGWGGFNTQAEDAELVRENRKKDGICVR